MRYFHHHSPPPSVNDLCGHRSHPSGCRGGPRAGARSLPASRITNYSERFGLCAAPATAARTSRRDHYIRANSREPLRGRRRDLTQKREKPPRARTLSTRRWRPTRALRHRRDAPRRSRASRVSSAREDPSERPAPLRPSHHLFPRHHHPHECRRASPPSLPMYKPVSLSRGASMAHRAGDPPRAPEAPVHVKAYFKPSIGFGAAPNRQCAITSQNQNQRPL